MYSTYLTSPSLPLFLSSFLSSFLCFSPSLFLLLCRLVCSDDGESHKKTTKRTTTERPQYASEIQLDSAEHWMDPWSRGRQKHEEEEEKEDEEERVEEEEEDSEKLKKKKGKHKDKKKKLV